MFRSRYRLDWRVGNKSLTGNSCQTANDSILLAAITQWRSIDAPLISLGGYDHASFAASNVCTSFDVGGVTFIFEGKNQDTYRTRQFGIITKLYVDFSVAGTGAQVKFKVFYADQVAQAYTFLRESALLAPPGTGLQLATLATPVVIEPGCVCAVWLGNTVTKPVLRLTSSVGAHSRYQIGDVTTSPVFAAGWDYRLNFEPMGPAPYLAITGDSIAAGQTVYIGMDDTNGPGPLSGYPSELGYVLRGLCSDLLDYQNHAKGGQTFAWVASTGMVTAVASQAKKILVHCGVNDINTSRTWAQAEADLDTIKGLLGVGQTLLIDEILPNTNFNDTKAAEIRTWNANLAIWCAANGATLVLCHDAMGQTRTSTGQLDDLKTAYNKGDGVHLSPTGVTALATIVKRYL